VSERDEFRGVPVRSEPPVDFHTVHDPAASRKTSRSDVALGGIQTSISKKKKRTRAAQRSIAT
jgi:hypothetical protein